MIDRRNLAEDYCKIAETLTAKDGVLFCLYYRNGYSTVQLGKLFRKKQYINLTKAGYNKKENRSNFGRACCYRYTYIYRCTTT
ncbi:hypothetical protein LCGC14_2411940 [marine sediment metagenome]|uniref:Uncharacterized protein n=1 Tax=marine sediment metagenome TaxID=412755 RepID=A0A0F9ELQ9_9ZZZZ